MVQTVKCLLQCRRPGFSPWFGKSSWRRKWQPTPVFLPAESHGQRSQAGYSPWGHKELDMTEHTHMEKLEPLFIVVGKVNDVVSVGKSLAVPQKVKYINLKNFNLSYDLAI